MPHYKLHYFNWNGRGQLARLIFAVADVPFEDYRITAAEWFPEGGLKSSTVLILKLTHSTSTIIVYTLFEH